MTTAANSELAFVFPGQGSQSLGMLQDLAETHPVIHDTFAEASEALRYDLWEIVQRGPAEELNKTTVTQPAMLAAGVAVWRLWQQQGGVMPAVMAGHSLGEYTALVCAGALDFRDAAGLVADRGRFMQEAVPAGKGAMAAILGLDDGKVIAACESAAKGQIVSAVNFNSVGQVVIAGEKEAVERAIDAATEAGAKRAVLLPVSVPSHCELMEPAAKRLAERLQKVEIREPGIPVINNVDVESPRAADEIKSALVRQLHMPVRWVETVQAMAAGGITHMVEAGPGKVLTGLARRINKDIGTDTIFDPATLEKTLSSLGG